MGANPRKKRVGWWKVDDFPYRESISRRRQRRKGLGIWVDKVEKKGDKHVSLHLNFISAFINGGISSILSFCISFSFDAHSSQFQMDLMTHCYWSLNFKWVFALASQIASRRWGVWGRLSNLKSHCLLSLVSSSDCRKSTISQYSSHWSS